MINKHMTFVEADRVLKSWGFEPIRHNGSHVIYSRGIQRFVLPRNMKTVSQKTWQRECKKNGLDFMVTKPK